MFVRAYLRASTEDQNASRARADLEAFLGAIAGICEFFRDELGGVFMHSAQIRAAMIGHHAWVHASNLASPNSARKP